MDISSEPHAFVRYHGNRYRDHVALLKWQGCEMWTSWYFFRFSHTHTTPRAKKGIKNFTNSSLIRSHIIRVRPVCFSIFKIPQLSSALAEVGMLWKNAENVKSSDWVNGAQEKRNHNLDECHRRFYIHFRGMKIDFHRSSSMVLNENFRILLSTLIISVLPRYISEKREREERPSFHHHPSHSSSLVLAHTRNIHSRQWI